MAENLQIPEGYQKMFSEYAKANHQTELTAFANLMDFIQIKEGVFDKIKIAVEDPKRYLNDAESMNAQAVLQLYMDTFAEDNVGATVYGYYNPDVLDTLLLDIEYDSEVAVWELLAMFHYQIPSMDILEDQTLELFYVSDIQGEKTKETYELFQWFENPDREDDGFGKAGYYEPLYDEPDDEEYFDEDDQEGYFDVPEDGVNEDFIIYEDEETEE